MGVSYRYWDECVDPEDMQEMWMDPNVTSEWVSAGEAIGSKVHLSCDYDGLPYLTQTELKAVAGIIVRRHFVSHLESDMLCAIAELESERHPLISNDKRSKGTAIGLMQILPKTAEWLISELGYNEYDLHGDSDSLYKPFINLYLGAAYLQWLSNYKNIERSEEFMVRAYHGGVKKATNKSTLSYWKRYLSVKESLPSRQLFRVDSFPNAPASRNASSDTKVPMNTTWESRASAEDMEYMWNIPGVNKEWTKSREKRGKVRISHDSDNKPYLSRVELKGVAETIVSKYFRTKGVKPIVLCALAELISKRFMNGVGQRTGLMGIDFPTARWMYKELGYKAYEVESSDDLKKPFVSMYFGAAYFAWLSEYEGRERSMMFVINAYMLGPNNLNLEEKSPIWVKFDEALNHYKAAPKKEQAATCCMMWPML